MPFRVEPDASGFAGESGFLKIPLADTTFGFSLVLEVDLEMRYLSDTTIVDAALSCLFASASVSFFPVKGSKRAIRGWSAILIVDGSNLSNDELKFSCKRRCCMSLEDELPLLRMRMMRVAGGRGLEKRRGELEA